MEYAYPSKRSVVHLGGRPPKGSRTYGEQGLELKCGCLSGQSAKVCNQLCKAPALTSIFLSSLAARLGTVPGSSGWYQCVLSPPFSKVSFLF